MDGPGRGDGAVVSRALDWKTKGERDWMVEMTMVRGLRS